MEKLGNPLEGLKDLSFYGKELHTLGTTSLGTQVHKSRTGSFIVTGGSSIKGGQTLANLVKGHSPEKLQNDVASLATNMMDALQQNINIMRTTSNPSLKNQIFREIVSLDQKFHTAEGDQKHGLLGLIHTYPTIDKALNASISFMQNGFRQAIRAARQEMHQAGLEEGEHLGAITRLPYSPEEHFTDAEWEKAIENSHHLEKECISMEKYLKYAVSLKFNRAMNALDATKASAKSILGDDAKPTWSWWNKILTLPSHDGTNTPSLYLGAIPLTKSIAGMKYDNHLDGLAREGIQAVLSLVEVFENNSKGVLTSPITPKEFEEAGIMQFQVPTPDFESMPLELIQRGVEFIHWNLSQGRSVYVHCKAGRGRSFLVEACYLIKHQNMTAEQAYQLVQSNRPQAGLEKAKMDTLKEFERLYRWGQNADAEINRPPREGQALSEKESKG